jgi:signal transduction histidine kinase
LELLQANPQEAARLLRGLKTQNQETVAEIRRLVYELRPPALDELGFIGALQAHVAQLSGRSALAVRITVQPDPLPPLSAAVEVAAYRIALEAITNVIRHAQAQRCTVQVQVWEDGFSRLQIDISDNGVGLPPDPQPGMGTHSMRERAEELGGSLVVASLARGTRVTAVLPL